MAKYFTSLLRKLLPNKIPNSSNYKLILNHSICSDENQCKPKKKPFTVINVNRAEENTTYWYRKFWSREFNKEYPECGIILYGTCVAVCFFSVILCRLSLTRDDVSFTRIRPYEGINYDFMHPRSRKLFKYQVFYPNPTAAKIFCEMKEAQKALDKK